jgi:hypothetical protein
MCRESKLFGQKVDHRSPREWFTAQATSTLRRLPGGATIGPAGRPRLGAVGPAFNPDAMKQNVSGADLIDLDRTITDVDHRQLRAMRRS